MNININTGLLDVARQCPSPNYDERPEGCEPSLIVVHNISLPPNEFGGEWIDKLFTNQLDKDAHPFFEEICHLQVASHLLIRRDGEIVQYVPFHFRAFHAGKSNYKGKDACNDFSIGIELEGSDYINFTEEQYIKLIETIHCLIKNYPAINSQDITGHQHIAPDRKTDPGPYFDWSKLSQALGSELPSKA